MNENPYDAPQAAVASTEPDNSPAGLWRDRELLVMRIHDRTFPRRCVKTNETFHGAATRLDVDWIPNHGMWLLLLGALGHAIAKSMYGKTISVEIPVSQQWLRKRKRTANIGGAMILGGICCFVLGTVGYVFAMASGMDDRSSQWIIFVTLAAPLVAIAGVIYLFACHKPIVTARKITTEHAWIDSISPDFLASLPEWPR